MKSILIILLICCFCGYGIASVIIYVKDNQLGNSPSPKSILTHLYDESNTFFKTGDFSEVANMERYFSSPFKRVLKKLPGLLIYTMARETRKGTLIDFQVVDQRIVNDSALVVAVATYQDSTSKRFTQSFVKEDGHWKIALKYLADSNKSFKSKH